MGKFGLTEGTRHYVQYSLTDGEGWQDLIHIDPDGESRGLWCSHRITTAEARIQELMAECDTQRDQYRIVRRTFQFAEEIVEFDPNYGKAFNDSTLVDPTEDEDEDDEDSTDEDEDNPQFTEVKE